MMVLPLHCIFDQMFLLTNTQPITEVKHLNQLVSWCHLFVLVCLCMLTWIQRVRGSVFLSAAAVVPIKQLKLHSFFPVPWSQ